MYLLDETKKTDETSDTDEHNSSIKTHSKKESDSVLADGVIQLYDDHEDSVYVAEWSSADPWTFASLSYDGRLVVNQVPRNIKFKIICPGWRIHFLINAPNLARRNIF